MIIDPNLSARNKRIAAIWCRATSNHAVLGNLEVDPLDVTMVDSHGKAVNALALQIAHSAEVDMAGDTTAT